MNNRWPCLFLSVMTMIEKIREFVERHQLLKGQDVCLVALSGGADSVALLLVLRDLGYALHAVHCNFHLRGEESDRDEWFCDALCQRLQVPFHRIHFDTKTYAEVHHVSIELAARELRYTYFEQLRRDLKVQHICVAHHRDDAAETILMNLVRGTGIHGLTGIKPCQGHIVRPLLCVSRGEIEAFLKGRQQDYVTDSTNLMDEATRNKVRHQLVPLLRQLNAGAVDHLLEMSERMTSVEALVDERLKPLRGCREMEITQLLQLANSPYLLYEVLRYWGFNARQCRQIYDGLLSRQSGHVFSAGENDLLIDRDRIIVNRKVPEFKRIRIPEEGIYVIGDNEKIRVKHRVRTADFKPSRQPWCATVDAAKVCFPLTLRRVEEGDRMVPYGMNQSKLLSDLMTNCKLTLFEKRSQRVVEDGNGNLVWLMGLRVDNRVAVDEMTTEILTLEVVRG